MSAPCPHVLWLLFGLIILDVVLPFGSAGAQRIRANWDGQRIQRVPVRRKLSAYGCGRFFSLIPKIFGGEDAAFGANPWQAALFQKAGISPEPFCGGALIHPEFVLTAAHCVDDLRPSDMIVRLGEHDWKDDMEWLPHEDHAIEEIIVHEAWAPASSTLHDIAMIRLARAVELSHSKWHINTICLPARQARFVGKTAKVSGWGLTAFVSDLEYYYYAPSVLQEANVQILNNSDCRAVWNVHFVEGMLCAGRKAGGSGFCDAVSGNPLSVIGENGRAQLIGVASFTNCDDESFLGAYTSVADHLDWIEANMGL